MSIEDLINSFYLRHILIGLCFGFIHFNIMSPIDFKASKDYLKLILFNSILLVLTIPIGYLLFLKSLESISGLSNMSTNTVFVMFCMCIFIFTSFIFFGFIRIKNHSSHLDNTVFDKWNLSFLFDLNLYWFFFNAWLISLYFETGSDRILLLITGFIMALTISNLFNHLKSSSII